MCEVVHQTFRETSARAAVLELHGISKHFGRRRVLTDVNLRVLPGQIVAVIGSNGAGKSTLLEICAGLARATHGSLTRTGELGWVPQSGGLYPLLTVGEHLRLVGAARGLHGEKALAEGAHLATDLGWDMEQQQKVGELSGGTQQKLNVMLGRLGSPPLLLLDEPYQGFDRLSYVDFWQALQTWRDAGTAIVLVTHLLHETDQVDQVLDLSVERSAR